MFSVNNVEMQARFLTIEITAYTLKGEKKKKKKRLYDGGVRLEFCPRGNLDNCTFLPQSSVRRISMFVARTDSPQT